MTEKIPNLMVPGSFAFDSLYPAYVLPFFNSF